jgi:hypothetical protein
MYLLKINGINVVNTYNEQVLHSGHHNTSRLYIISDNIHLGSQSVYLVFIDNELQFLNVPSVI